MLCPIVKDSSMHMFAYAFFICVLRTSTTKKDNKYTINRAINIISKNFVQHLKIQSTSNFQQAVILGCVSKYRSNTEKFT